MFSSNASTTAKPESSDVIDYRLPTSLTPVHYDIELFPNIYSSNPKNFTFSGTVVIEIKVLNSTRTITLHADAFNITETSMQLLDGGKRLDLPIITYTHSDDVRQFYVIHLDRELQTGQTFLLTMRFEGEMRHDSVGLYTTYYLDGETKVYMAVSQFAGPHARKVFPCFDEPAQKATFNITVLRKANTRRNYRCLSNQERLRTDPRPGGLLADVFRKTPPMSTYLLAVIVCDYQYLENVTRDGVKVSLYGNDTLRTCIERGRAQIRSSLLNVHMTMVFACLNDSVPLPKFKFSGMENWGIITYKTDILFEPGVTTAATENWMVDVISHEISHQWFGNLVTPKWFRWVWLNEGFASFWDATVCDKLYPKFRKGDLEIVESVYPVMVQDSHATSHAMTYDVNSPRDIDASYNTITYKKAASIIRMMRDILGEDVFISGLNRYFQKNAYSTVDQNDLFAALNEEILKRGRQINITAVMDSWVNQKNYPVLNVRVVSAGVMHVQQERFLLKTTNDSTDSAQYGYKWQIPISFTSNREKNFTKSRKFEDLQWLSKFEREKIIKSSIIPEPTESGSWVIVNLVQSGFYRVNYEDTNWLALIRQLTVNNSVSEN
ncbi:aminopeptidase N-like [Gigantopelta aegis]|uniref:aminopeptidase N-like n=1 Tax=Gigantopelta aegis TaxID=1735272 RepID=UPI001B88CB8C|nr:aminopeptidase N-like [Gigantopelta aegis]